MGWIDTLVLVIVVGVGLGIFYKALKEPIDHLLYWIKVALGGAAEGIRNMGGSAVDSTQTITYG